MFNNLDMWRFQLPGQNYILKQSFPAPNFKCLFEACISFLVLCLLIFQLCNATKKARTLCSKEVRSFLLKHVTSWIRRFFAMLHSVGFRKQRGEGQWLSGVLIRCRSSQEHQTIKSRVCCNPHLSSSSEWAEMDSELY